MAASNVGHHQPFSENIGATHGLSESTPEMPTCEISYSRFAQTFLFSKFIILMVDIIKE